VASYAVGGAQRKTDMGAGQVGGGKLEVASWRWQVSCLRLRPVGCGVIR